MNEIEKFRKIQQLTMQIDYSYFKIIENSIEKLVFVGILKPTENSNKYLVKIEYLDEYIPRVFVIDKELNKMCPHLNSDASLCLFHQSEFRWRRNDLISKRLIPVILSWLYHYEIWEDFGVWKCDEYPH